MTSISATPSSYQSPLQLLQAELQSEVNSGAVSSSDQGALSSALTDINSSLQSGSPASGAASTTNSSPGDLKSKIDNLIAGEVSSGKLTSQQATELQGVFQNAFANGPGGAGAPADAGSADATTAPTAPPAGAPPGGAYGQQQGGPLAAPNHSFARWRSHCARPEGSFSLPVVAAGCGRCSLRRIRLFICER